MKANHFISPFAWNILLLWILLPAVLQIKTSHAQGWSFSFQLAYQGDCGGANIQLPTIPPVTFSTKPECESFKQYVESISFSGGGCTVYYTVSQCTGSDMVVSGQINPGDVNFDGQNTGNPFFSTHNSKAYEDWARDYIQQLQSYGVNSILNNNFGASVPQTGNRDFDAFYSSGSSSFNPTTTNQQADATVKPDDYYGTVQLLTTKEEQAKRDQWYNENVALQGYADFSQMDENNTIKPGYTFEQVKWAGLETALSEAPGIHGAVGGFGVNIAQGSTDGIDQVLTCLSNHNDANAVSIGSSLSENIVSNALADYTAGAIIDKLGTPLLKAVPAATAVHTVIKVSTEFWKNLNN